MRTAFIILILFFFAGFVSSDDVDGTMRICVKGSMETSGTVWYSICSSEAEFMADRGGTVRSMVFKDGLAETYVKGLKPGTYAVKLFVDMNANHYLDQGFLGIPTEPWGFSNNAIGLLGYPSFSSASFQVSARHIKKVLVNLKGE